MEDTGKIENPQLTIFCDGVTFLLSALSNDAERPFFNLVILSVDFSSFNIFLSWRGGVISQALLEIWEPWKPPSAKGNWNGSPVQGPEYRLCMCESLGSILYPFRCSFLSYQYQQEVKISPSNIHVLNWRRKKRGNRGNKRWYWEEERKIRKRK